MNFTYRTIAGETQSDFRDRGSKFFGYAFPVASVEDCKSSIQRLKKEHPKASHYCFAWKLGHDGSATRVSDDGEPSGSAGRPIEGQILSRALTNIMVVVVRYFGGSLLGVPGLINAYKTAAAEALDKAAIIEKNIEYLFSIRFDYTVMNEVMMAVRESACRIVRQDQGLFCDYALAVPIENKEKVLVRMKEIRGLEILGIH